MAKTVIEEYAELYHYTTAEGLHGIIAKQYLRATNIAFLNDSEERIRYLDRQMPVVIERAVEQAISELAYDPEVLKIIEQEGGHEKNVRDLSSQLIKEIRRSTTSFDEPYVTSFCRTDDSRIARDGLLSQWRGYGENGGYAIVFDTKGLDALLEEENKRHLYLSVRWGDINYHDGEVAGATQLEEVRESEKRIYDCIVDFVKTQTPSAFEEMFDPITSLSCLTKHWGFHEENEVRVVAILGKDHFVQEARKLGEDRPDKFVHHFSRSGVLVPCINLFEDLTSNLGKKLPIKSIIVGPHPDKLKRKQSVELLLKQYGVQAEVTVSDIPYIPR